MSHHGTHFAVGTSASYSLLKSASGYSHVPGFVFLLAPLDAVKRVCVLVSGSGHSPELTSLRPLFSLIALFARSARFFSRGAREEVDASFFGAPEKKSTLRSLRPELPGRWPSLSDCCVRCMPSRVKLLLVPCESHLTWAGRRCNRMPIFPLTQIINSGLSLSFSRTVFRR